MRGPVQGKGSGVLRGGRSVGGRGGGVSRGGRGVGAGDGRWGQEVLGKEPGEEGSRTESGVEAARAGGSVAWTRE